VIGELLATAPDEWAAVPMFYSAFHLVRAALVTDPLFDDPGRCARKNVYLSMQDRECTRHNTRWRREADGSRSKLWGVNELVTLLYAPIWPYYELMHQASVEVRYGRGLIHPLQRVCEALDEITRCSSAGLLVAS
jgi:hypothetical protein